MSPKKKKKKGKKKEGRGCKQGPFRAKKRGEDCLTEEVHEGSSVERILSMTNTSGEKGHSLLRYGEKGGKKKGLLLQTGKEDRGRVYKGKDRSPVQSPTSGGSHLLSQQGGYVYKYAMERGKRECSGDRRKKSI